MDTKTSLYAMNVSLAMQTPSGRPIEVDAADLIFGEEDGEVLECRMIAHVRPGAYERIEKENLFNLAPESRGPAFGGSLDPEREVKIELALDVDVLDGLLEQVSNVKEAAKYLSSRDLDDPLLLTENWYALYLTQQVDLPDDLGEGTLNVGYKTSWAEELDTMVDEPTALADVVAGYLEEDGWPLSEMDESGGFYSRYQGSSGEWTCYARTREEQEQFIFYSIAPVKTPEDRLNVMAEFLTRANYGLPVGNFEMDWESGEIRCKTSIDVEGAELTNELVRNVVEANLALMERYLPGIEAVLAGEAVVKALQKAEE